ncbi:hypothetical protein [Arundinibacter roseus]|uniref:Rod shape-determining protein MreD n=1 Tax=Arundinibacter roseus TaxID=2070510 RepID=A0A4R4KPS5_9BACT|nr:hypothetical protein [Arundinibacter roseus]TDB68926.1 hypothetical protein EZE20_00895 [Arundinibacter roseus]
MSLREIIQYSLWFLLYLVLQILILRNVVLFDYGFCFIYVAGIVLLPAEVNRTALLFMGFLTGFILDVFYNTLGIHAAATVLIAYLRPFWIQLQLETKGTTERLEITLSELGVGGYLAYLIPLIFVHHSVLFLIEMSHFGMIGYTLLRIVASTLFTTLLIVLIQLFSRR